MIAFLKLVIYTPLYNLLLVILNFLPNHDVGLAIVLLTILVKFLIYPLSKKAAVAQAELKKREPELAAIREKFKDKEKQAVEVMNFYKKHNINPFSSIFMVLLQIPIIYSLYHIFLHSGLPVANMDLLYSFTPSPDVISMNFLRLIDVSSKNVFLAILAAITSYIQIRNSVASPASTSKSEEKEFGSDLASTMTAQMKYTFPLVVFFISWKISGAIALYWLVSNLFTIAQDYWIKKKINEEPKEPVLSSV